MEKSKVNVIAKRKKVKISSEKDISKGEIWYLTMYVPSEGCFPCTSCL